MKISCLLFDLDGTVLNTNDLVLECLKYTIQRHLGTDVPECELYKYFGQPLVDIMGDLDPGQAEAMVTTYREYNAQKHDNLTKVFPHVPETLRALKSKGVTTALVTSKLKRLALNGLRLFELEGLFDACIAFEDTDSHKPEPEPIHKALDVLGFAPDKNSIVMVGDSPYDILCANNAGVASAVVGWSLHPREVLAAAAPDIWLEDFRNLLKYI